MVLGAGEKDLSFDTGVPIGFNDGVNTLSQQADGKILVVGGFDQYKGETVGYGIIRLNSDGSRDATFDTGTGFNNGVRTLSQQPDGKILVGGSFESYKDKPAAYLIRVGQ